MGFLILFSLFLLVSGDGFVGAHDFPSALGFKPKKLFVFGDSYADTGNVRKSLGDSWRQPYGITVPGKPAGRFSDGLILTDYLAKFLGLRSPLGYIWRNFVPHKFTNGMNFAFGGSGVFDTFPGLPNMTAQIDSLELLIANNFYTKNDLKSSAVLVTCAGNDYAAYLMTGGSMSDIKDFINGVVNQLVVNLKRIHRLGARKIVVAGLQPLGCLPRMTAMTGYKSCIDVENLAVGYHNSLLKHAVEELDNHTSSFLLLDLYMAFETAIITKKNYRGDEIFETPLTPCCDGMGTGYSCATVANNGTEYYTLCGDRSKAFFWDSSHPTEAGWRTVFSLLQRNVERFFRL